MPGCGSGNGVGWLYREMGASGILKNRLFIV